MLKGREIFYRHIRRIVYNQYHNRIYIYGKVKCIYYKNYRRNPEDNTWYNDKKKSAHIRLTMIFHNNREILEQIKKYSPVEIEVVNHPVEY